MDRMESTRAFIAIEIAPNVRKKITAITSEMECNSARPVKEEQIHMTLLFLGSINDAQIKGMTEAISQIDVPQFNLSFGGIGTFGRVPRVIFANVLEGEVELRRIYSVLRESAEKLKIKLEDRDFAAHATIARIKDPSKEDVLYLKGFIASHSEDSFGSFTCKEIKLKSSVLGEHGPTHSDLYTKALSP